MTSHRDQDDLESFFAKADNDQTLEPNARAISEEERVAETPDDEGDGKPKPGLLGPPARAALQRLLSRGTLLSRTYPDDYLQLLSAKPQIEQILATMGLSMQIHMDYGMAVLMRNEDITVEDPSGTEEDEEGGSVLVRTTRLTLLHSLLLMVLRIHWRERERAGDQRVIIDIETMKERLNPYWPLLNAEARSDKRFNGAVRKMQDHGVLLNVRGREDQREISPVILLALDSQKLAVMVSEYSRLAQTGPTGRQGAGDE
jgi:hypothetical protein